MNRSKQVLMIVPCEAHTEQVMRVLDESQVRDWVVIPASQGRRAGHLVYAPPIRERTCDAILGMADSETVATALDSLKQAVHGQGLCPDCLAYVWQADEVLLGEAAFDPVCGMSVDRRDALSATHDGVSYYFCAPECRDQFVNDPEAYVGG